MVVTAYYTDGRSQDIREADYTTNPVNGTFLYYVPNELSRPITISHIKDGITKHVVLEVTVNKAAAIYLVTVSDSYAERTGAGNYVQGARVAIDAGSRSEYVFGGWTTASGGVVFDNAKSAATSFNMPTNNVQVRAEWTRIEIPQAEKPSANYRSGKVAPGSGVTLSSATSGAVIYYTLDGSNPTKSSARYAAPIVINGATTIKAMAVKEGMRDSQIAIYSYTVILPEARLTGISRLSLETNQGAAVFVDAGTFGVSGDGEGNFYATLYGNTGTLTVHGVRYVIENVPAGALPEYEIVKGGAVLPLIIYRAAAPQNGYESVAGVTFGSGERGVYKLYSGEVLAGTFTVVYVNEDSVADVLDVEQSEVDGVYYFAPVDLPATGNRYEIVSRPDTLGGKAVRINAAGQLIFNQQAIPMNVSRAGEYVVREVDADGNVVNVYIITVY